jgi:hypothetical protein
MVIEKNQLKNCDRFPDVDFIPSSRIGESGFQGTFSVYTYTIHTACEDLMCDWKIYSQRNYYKSVARKRIVKTSGNRLKKLVSTG